jgi:hypothetical protein
MSEHEERGHHRHHQTHSQEGADHPWWRRAHRDWRLWIVVGLMLVAMIIYVMTMDEALPPGGKVKPAVPAAP